MSLKIHLASVRLLLPVSPDRTGCRLVEVFSILKRAVSQLVGVCEVEHDPAAGDPIGYRFGRRPASMAARSLAKSAGRMLLATQLRPKIRTINLHAASWSLNER